MFRKFTRADNIRTQSKVKSSEQRGVRAAILDQYPLLEPHIDDILPKKADMVMCKCKDATGGALQLVLNPENEPIFFQCRSGPFIPTLRLLHRYPEILPRYQVDRGAIRFVLSGANIMAPGLTSKGGYMEDVASDTPVAIFAEGKEHALAIGITMASTAEIRAENKGNAVENTHWLNDGLWVMKTAEA